MTEKRLHELVGLWKHRLGLDLWDITIAVEEISEPHYAELRRSTAYDRAQLVVTPWMLQHRKPPRDDMLQIKATDEFIEQAVVHELLHAVLRDHQAVIQDDIEGFLHRDVQSMLEKLADRINEQTIERLARALVLAWREER